MKSVWLVNASKGIFPMAYTEEGLEKLAEIVRSARGNMSERGFAEMIGVTNTTISRIEKCEVQEPKLDTLDKLSGAVGYTREELIAILEMNPNNPNKQPVKLYKTAEDAVPVVDQLPKREMAKLAKYLIDKITAPKATKTQAT